MRLNRFLASAGLGSRRSVEELIRTEQVKVNGRVVTDLATKVTPDDAVKVGSRLLQIEKTLTAVLNKPRGYVCTAADDLDRRTIFDLLPANWPRVFHVGRLDKESEGLLIVTNDGDLSLALTHPRYKIDKEYEVLLDKPFVPTDRAKLLKGFHILGGRAKIEHLEQLGPNHLRVVLTQGIKRQIRLMLYELGYEVERLVRVRIGPLKIGETRPGDWRILTPKEIATLKSPETAPATRGLGARPRKSAPPRKFPRPAGPEAAPARENADRPAPGTRPERKEARPAAPGGDLRQRIGGAAGSQPRPPQHRPDAPRPTRDPRRSGPGPSGERPYPARKPVGSRTPPAAPDREYAERPAPRQRPWERGPGPGAREERPARKPFGNRPPSREPAREDRRDARDSPPPDRKTFGSRPPSGRPAGKNASRTAPSEDLRRKIGPGAPPQRRPTRD